MRKLLLKMSISIDGFVGGPNGEIDWIFQSMDDASAEWVNGILRRAGLHIMGSRTFHDMVSYWPTSTEPFAAPMNEISKAVFTRKGIAGVYGDPAKTTTALKQANEVVRENKIPLSPVAAMESWEKALVLTGDLAEEIGKLKAQPGKDILAHGGASFCQSLVATGLVDEFYLLTHPFVLGKGLPLFSAVGQPERLRLIDVKAFPGGNVGHCYSV